MVAPHDEFRQVQELLTTFEQFGIRQIVIQTHVLRDTAESIKRLPINWSHVEAASRIAQVPKPSLPDSGPTDSRVLPASFEQATPRTVAAWHHQRQLPVAPADLPPPVGVTSETWTEATSIIERATPVLYTLLTPAEFHAVLLRAKEITTLERIMSPSVVVFNGQVARISNSVERPFVIGVKPMMVGPEGKQQIEFSPTIKVYPEGTTMKIRPQLFEGQRVRLNYQLDLCKVRDVETLKLPGIDGQRDFSVQMPEVASTQFRTCLDMPINYTLAVSAFDTDDQGVKRSVVILCHCSLRDVAASSK